ncbi:MAG: hypothetical protein ABWY78_02075 [Microvirga sp.]
MVQDAGTDAAGEAARPGWAGRVLVAGAVACVVAAGLLLWSIHGPVVFNDLVVSALAWCF